MLTAQECQKDTFYLVLQQCLNIKLTEHGRIHKIFNVTEIENLLEIDNLEE